MVAFCWISLPAAAQKQYSWDDFVQEYATDDELLDEEARLVYLEELKLLHEHPVNINTASIEDLRQIPFLNEQQIESIHAYIYLHGEMKTLGELLLLPLIDTQTYRWLHLFVYAGEAKKEEKTGFFGHLRNDLSSRTDIPLYYRKGFKADNGYAGNFLYHRIKYELGNSKHFRAGFHTEKDAGEYVLKHDFAPAVVDGIAGLMDSISGTFKTCEASAASPLTYGGAFTPNVVPASAATLGVGESTTFVASAPGATSYRWTRNGQAIAGGENGTLTVHWRRGGGTDAYRAIARYAIDDAICESAPSASVSVENVKSGLSLIIR